MTQGKRILATAIAVILAAGGGYWAGQGKSTVGAPTAAAAAPAKAARQILYYRNPMGLPDTSPVPKKDAMGMDYVPVYAGDEEPGGENQLKFSPEKVQKLGVRVETAVRRALGKQVRAAGRVEVDERRSFTIAPKFEGWIERLHVNTTGQVVAKGQPLFEVYSPELVSAQREYAIAVQGASSLSQAGDSARAGMQQLADSALVRLRNWDLPAEQIKALEKSGEAKRTVTFRSPVAGVVTEKKALQGMRFMPGDALYQVADISSVWVQADVFEQDIAEVRPGAQARVRIDAYPDKVFAGKVAYVYPTLKAETRTVQVRIELPNPGGLLKPAMFAQVEIPVAGQGDVLTVPTSAIIDSGTRRVVLVQVAEGRFEPRDVKLGDRSDNYVAVQEGVKEGEKVVVAANFLIDAESNLKAAVGGFGHAGHGGAAKPADAPAGEHASHGQDTPATPGNQAEGTIESLDIKTGALSVRHGPVASLKWPAMTMDFQAANPSLLAGLKPGAAIAFEFVERKPGEWVVTRLQPLEAAPGGTAAAAHSHAAH